MKKGLIQVYTGEGKGKTTASLGLAFRAYGRGWRVLVFQFMKAPDSSGEHFAAQDLGNDFKIIPVGRKGFIFNKTPAREDVRLARDGLALAVQAMVEGEVDLVVLDEIDVAVSLGLLTEEEVLAALEAKAESTEVVLTGRNAPRSVLEKADLITEMRMVKHPYQNGIQAREGIEF